MEWDREDVAVDGNDLGTRAEQDPQPDPALEILHAGAKGGTGKCRRKSIIASSKCHRLTAEIHPLNGQISTPDTPPILLYSEPIDPDGDPIRYCASARAAANTGRL